MLRGDEIDVMAAGVLQLKHHLGQVAGRCLRPNARLADVVILTEDAAQVAHREEDSAAAFDAAEAVLFTEMGEIAGHQGEATCFADGRFICQAVDVAVPRTDPALGQTGDGHVYTVHEFSRAIE